MKIVGIDFSTTCPAMCIANDKFTDFQFSALIMEHKISHKNKLFLDEIEESVPDLYFSYQKKSVPDSDAYYVTERAKAMSYKALADGLSMEIRRLIGDDDCIVAMEGISYGSQGSSLVDISIATGMFRYNMLANVVSTPQQFFVFSPSEMKNAIGCKGNATKTEVLERFIHMPGIEDMRNSYFYKFVERNMRHEYVFNGKDVKSPFQDLIDSYLAVLKVYNIINGK